MRAVILTKAQAETIRSRQGSEPGHILDPVEMDDGNFMLPERCLNDPHHAAHRTYLNARSKRDVGDADFAQKRAEASGK